MRIILVILMLFFGFNAFADGESNANKVVEISWRSDQQICNCSIDESMGILLDPTNGVCHSPCVAVFPNDIASISDEYLEELTCSVAKRKIEFKDVPGCDAGYIDLGLTAPAVKEVDDYDWGSTEKNGTDRFHKIFTVKKERECAPKCRDSTTEKDNNKNKTEIKRPKVKVLIFDGPPQENKDEKKEDDGKYPPLEPIKKKS